MAINAVQFNFSLTYIVAPTIYGLMHQTLITGSLSHITQGPNLQALSGHALYSLAGWQMPIRHVHTTAAANSRNFCHANPVLKGTSPKCTRFPPSTAVFKIIPSPI